MTKRVIQSSIVVLAMLITVACSKSQDPIVGKWQDVEKAQIVEFSKDKKLSVSGKGFSMTGSYEITDGRVKVDFEGGLSTTLTVNITGDELAITDQNGVISRYKRV
jgi:hypothetical protein